MEGCADEVHLIDCGHKWCADEVKFAERVLLKPSCDQVDRGMTHVFHVALYMLGLQIDSTFLL